VAANIKDLDRRIRSVRNTQQITKAMKMVAAAKLRRTHDRLLAGRPYGLKLTELLAQLASAASIDHPFLTARAVEKRLMVVVTSDKGLCGSYNHNVIRMAHEWMEKHSDVPNDLYIVGRKANEYFKRRPWQIKRAITDMGGLIDLDRIQGTADELMQLYLENEYQEIVVAHTRFLSTLSYRPQIVQLLPFPKEENAGAPRGMAKDYIYEPSAEVVLQRLLPKSVRVKVFDALAESFTSEHGARMTSMSSATDNAGDLIDQLTLFRNRARQAAITQEISEIVGGANALA
jgi:F-type H+-transporting ATPase subunit gamma